MSYWLSFCRSRPLPTTNSSIRWLRRRRCSTARRVLPGPGISEIHYDTASTAAGEAIEISGRRGTDVTGWTPVLYLSQPRHFRLQLLYLALLIGFHLRDHLLDVRTLNAALEIGHHADTFAMVLNDILVKRPIVFCSG